MSVRKIVTGAVMAMAMGFAGMASVNAGDYGYGYHQPHCSYKWVTTWEFRTVESFVYVTEYDCHGYPIQVKKLIHKTIKVPVKKYVKFCY